MKLETINDLDSSELREEEERKAAEEAAAARQVGMEDLDKPT